MKGIQAKGPQSQAVSAARNLKTVEFVWLVGKTIIFVHKC